MIIIDMNNSLFLKEAYLDSERDYIKSINDKSFLSWDYIVISASNDKQKQHYEKQIALRKEYLPLNSKFLVYSDDDGKRIGSGGSTLKIIRQLKEEIGSFKNKKIMLIHSGGDSKRIPHLATQGKLFAPFPHKLWNGKSSSLFDEILITTASIPYRMKEGVYICSGDALLLFNPLFIYFSGRGLNNLSFKESVEIGQNHGVFLVGKDNQLKQLLHKKSVECLIDNKAVDENNLINIDTGSMFLGVDLLNDLYNLIDNHDTYDTLINEKVRLSLYADILYPLAQDSSLEDFYRQEGELQANEMLFEARKLLWQSLSKYQASVISLNNTQFIHLGTSKQYLDLWRDIDQYSDLNWCNKINSYLNNDCASAYNSFDNLIDNTNYYHLENSIIDDGVVIGDNTMISNLEISDNIHIPDNVILHGAILNNGKYVCSIYGIEYNPKDNKLFNIQIDQALWDKPLYLECDDYKQAIEYALKIYKAVHENNLSELNDCDKYSLSSIINNTDFDRLYQWNDQIKQLSQINKIEKAIDNNIPCNNLNLSISDISNEQLSWFDKRLIKCDFSKKMRMYYYLGKLSNNNEYIYNAFKYLAQYMLNNQNVQNKNLRIVKDSLEFQTYLRINFAGGWSDTPPYYLENGGTVLNCAITLNGDKPVKAKIEKLKEHIVIIESDDSDLYEEFNDLKQLLDISDTYNPCLLAKCVLIESGIINNRYDNLQDLLKDLGGGFKLSYEVENVPKGSGLGTSSILSASLVKIINDFVGNNLSDQQIYQHVLAVEQLMTTGGGWQDQVGGLSKGFKYITCDAGINKDINVEYLNLDEEFLNELNERFVLIYTGQRRLARNILRNVVGDYLGNDEVKLQAIKDTIGLAKKMKQALLDRDLERFSLLLDDQWQVTKTIDKDSSNDLIEHIFDSIDDLICGRMICGAGGGGFLYAIIDKNYSKQDVANRLKQVYPNSDIGIWDCELING